MTDVENMREAAATIVAHYDAMSPMRTGDFHAPDCQCLRCAIDLFRALPLPEPTEALVAAERREVLAEAMKLPEVVALVYAAERLNAACDAMWNDYERLEKNPGRFGQKYQIKDAHIRTISEAQQALPTILAALKGASHE